MTLTARAAVNWMFRDRANGKLVIAQRPNIALTVWLACAITRWLAHPHGRWATGLSVIGTGALVIWAVDEVTRGVNPWRRMLGGGVLAALVVGWALSR